MALIGIEISNNKHQINSQLLHYALSLFEGCDSEVLSHRAVKEEVFSIINTAELLILSLSEEMEDSNLENLIKVLAKVNFLVDQPFFLLATASNDHSDKLRQTVQLIEQKGGVVWDSFLLPHATDSFDSKEGVIATISLRLQLMRKVNHLRYEKLGVKDHQNSCGIRRRKGEYGDESEH